MFGTYLKSSLWVLPWLLIPVACFCLFVMGIDPYYIQDYAWAERVIGNRWGEFAEESARISLIISVVAHIVFLLLVPALIGGADPHSKRFEFYIGFFINIALAMFVPLYFKLTFGLDGTTFGILLVMHMFMFVVTFIVASRFVAPVYRCAFWFTYFN
jgi:hypothetical protein